MLNLCSNSRIYQITNNKQEKLIIFSKKQNRNMFNSSNKKSQLTLNILFN